ncbi:hypothetical protein CHCC20331_3242 [Bacillus paralicheniformis]|nr:hypothetical protein CHCC20331_3242 [Bacillus paralicheniformis]
MKKPLYLPFEKGLNAIAGVPFMPINSWGDFKKVNKQLTKNPEKAKEAYQTIIVDEVDAFSKYATKYVCDQYDVDRIKDGNDGKLSEEGRLEEVNEVTEKHLGQGARVTECTNKQTDVMSVILDDHKDLLEN